MFRALLQYSALTRAASKYALNLSSIASKATVENIEDEHNYVKLTGTIISNPKCLANGTKSIIVRTTESEDIYYNHQVNIKTDDSLSMGERIYIFGHLSSKPFSLDDGRLRQKLIIKATYHRMRGHESRTLKVRDQNNVQIVGKITSDILYTEKYVLLTIACHHMPKGDGRIPGLGITEFHQIIVYDKMAMSAARNIKKFDRILVEGKLSYMNYKFANHKKQHGGFITAQTIQRVI